MPRLLTALIASPAARRACLAVPLLGLVAIYWGYYVEIPILDEWSLLALYESIARGEGVVEQLLARENRVHVNVFPKLAFAALAFATDWSIRAEVMLNILVVAGTFVLLQRTSARHADARGPALRFASDLLMALLLASLIQMWTWGYGLVFFVINLAVALAVFLLTPAGPSRIALRVALAAAAAFVATFSHADGVLLWISLVPLVLRLVWETPARRGALVLWALAGAASIAGFAWGYEPARTGSGAFAGLVDAPLEAALHYLNLLGIPLGRFVSLLDPTWPPHRVHAPFGAAVLLAFAWLAFDRWRRDGPAMRLDLVGWIAIGVHVLLYAAVNTFGRQQLGGVIALALPMYATAPTLLVVAVVQLAAFRLAEAGGAAPVAPASSSRFPLGGSVVAGGLASVGALVVLNQIVALPLVLDARAQARHARYCMLVVEYLEPRSTCRLERSKVLRAEALGFREVARGLDFEARPRERVGAIDARVAARMAGRHPVLRIQGSVERAAFDGPAPPVFLSRSGRAPSSRSRRRAGPIGTAARASAPTSPQRSSSPASAWSRGSSTRRAGASRRSKAACSSTAAERVAAQRPLNSGGRFSRNARGPSRASSDVITFMPCCCSIAKASSSASISVSRRVARIALTARGPFAEIRSAISRAFSRALPSGTTWLTSPSS